MDGKELRKFFDGPEEMFQAFGLLTQASAAGIEEEEKKKAEALALSLLDKAKAEGLPPTTTITAIGLLVMTMVSWVVEAGVLQKVELPLSALSSADLSKVN